MQYSVIFVVEEESDEFESFFNLICRLLSEKGLEAEILVVANGTESFVRSELNSLDKNNNAVKVISFLRKVPQSLCLNAAMAECRGAEILALGPFKELSSDSYEKLIDAMTDGVDLVVPYRKKRKDHYINRLHSKLLNTAVKMVIGTQVNDIGCNVKLFRREVLEDMNLYGGMYRYFPALAAQKGFKIKEVECRQAEKIRKTRYYSLRLYLDRVIEIMNLFFSTNFSKKPLRFFSLVGSVFMAMGMITLVIIGIQRVFGGIPIGDRPILIVAMICFVGGAQIASFGLLGEVISFVHGRSRKEYTIEKTIG